jgi:hypothetical protein
MSLTTGHIGMHYRPCSFLMIADRLLPYSALALVLSSCAPLDPYAPGYGQPGGYTPPPAGYSYPQQGGGYTPPNYQQPQQPQQYPGQGYYQPPQPTQPPRPPAQSDYLPHLSQEYRSGYEIGAKDRQYGYPKDYRRAYERFGRGYESYFQEGYTDGYDGRQIAH